VFGNPLFQFQQGEVEVGKTTFCRAFFLRLYFSTHFCITAISPGEAQPGGPA
jgi:hypothetical protein